MKQSEEVFKAIRVQKQEDDVTGKLPKRESVLQSAAKGNQELKII